MDELANRASREKHITAQINKIIETINQLENWQSDYETRLADVTRLVDVTRCQQEHPKLETVLSNTAAPDEHLSPLAETLRASNNRIRHVINRMESLLERLEL